MSKKEREIYDFEMDFKKYILLLFLSEYPGLSNDDVIS